MTNPGVYLAPQVYIGFYHKNIGNDVSGPKSSRVGVYLDHSEAPPQSPDHLHSATVRWTSDWFGFFRKTCCLREFEWTSERWLFCLPLRQSNKAGCAVRWRYFLFALMMIAVVELIFVSMETFTDDICCWYNVFLSPAAEFISQINLLIC